VDLGLSSRRAFSTSGLPRGRPLEVAFWGVGPLWHTLAASALGTDLFRFRVLEAAPEVALDSESSLRAADGRLAASLRRVDVLVVGGSGRPLRRVCALAKAHGVTACVVDAPPSDPLPRSVDAFVVSSSPAARALRQRGATVLEVPAAASSDAIPDAGPQTEASQVKVAVWSGRLDAAHAPALFVRACAALRSTRPTLRCWLRGYGSKGVGEELPSEFLTSLLSVYLLAVQQARSPTRKPSLPRGRSQRLGRDGHVF
jgi:hypothetical protein